MLKLAMSSAAAAILRALIAKAGVASDRILLTDARSIDWQSLTFVGERHEIELRIPPPASAEVAERLCASLAEAEFDIPGHVVADIAVRGDLRRGDDGATLISIEALTIEE